MKYYEKADPMVMAECERFIQSNQDTSDNYAVFSEALRLCTKLIDSLLASHADFDDAIKNEFEKYNAMDDGIAKDIFVFKFNNTELSLVLDVKAHDVLDKLENIEKRNKRI